MFCEQNISSILRAGRKGESMSKSPHDYCIDKMTAPTRRSLAAEFPAVAAEWHPTKNPGLSPADVAPATHRKVWWLCERGHEWQAQVNARTRGTACPVCANRTVLAGVNDLATTHPELAAEWHPSRNGARTPRTVVHGNRSKVWWLCEKGHEWQATVLSRTSMGNGCPVCAGKVVQPGVNDLASVRPQIAAEWHPSKNAPLGPRDISPYSNRYVWWLCAKGHEYRTSVAHRSQSGTDCPYCRNKKVLAGFNDLATAEPRIAAEWHPELNGGLSPQMLTVGSRKKVWWRCSEGHVWQAVVYSRTGAKKCGCPVCSGRVRESAQRRYAEAVKSARRSE